MKSWTGDLCLSESEILKDVRLTSPDGGTILAPGARLTFLSLVGTFRIPLHIRCSTIIGVSTSVQATANWFGKHLCDDHQSGANPWWELAARQSNLGVLASIDNTNAAAKGRPDATEVLFFAVRSRNSGCPPTPPCTSRVQAGGTEISVKAVLLCSDLLQPSDVTGLTPPPSPKVSDNHIQGIYLPDPRDVAAAAKKRKLLSDTFDEASKRRRLTRMGPTIISESQEAAASVPAASLTRPSPVPALPDKRNLSRTASLQISKSRSQSPAPRPSTSGGDIKPAVNPLEQRNKDLISRLVLAGMRLHGLSQSKSKSVPRTEEEKQSDEEFKLVYHNTLRAVSFAFRESIGTMELKPHTVLLQEKVEMVLNLFCSDPLTTPIDIIDLTPSGRTPFKTPTMNQPDTGGFPFPASTEKVIESSPAQQVTTRGLNISGAAFEPTAIHTAGEKVTARINTQTKRRREPGF
ncbi:Hypothetical protein D9617_1g085760 [Elsinoe fawcettii]|nr:Hypothetical protein D9617_1g085760 [Elsinoe fawcettii]